jgi:hypothetical protein
MLYRRPRRHAQPRIQLHAGEQSSARPNQNLVDRYLWGR